MMAIVRAWTEAGSHPAWHFRMQQIVRSQMPVLGRALDRLAEEYNEWLNKQSREALMFFHLEPNKNIQIPEDLKPKAGE